MGRKKIKAATDQRRFTIVYNDFIESNLLTAYDKMVFIALKRYADNDTLTAFPSLNTLHRLTGISVAQVRRCIDHMEQLGVVSVEHRIDAKKGQQSNIYTLFDYAKIWDTDGKDDIETVADKITDAKLIAEIQRRGYVVTKKEPDSEPAKVMNQTLELNHLDVVNDNKHSQKSQAVERYTLDQVRQLYDYEIMVNDRPLARDTIDAAISVLYDSLNSNKDSIRIGGQDKPTMAVIGKLQRLGYPEILYCIDKFAEQTDRIKNPTGYMLTMLYHAKEQMALDLTNQVQHDFCPD